VESRVGNKLRITEFTTNCTDSSVVDTVMHLRPQHTGQYWRPTTLASVLRALVPVQLMFCNCLPYMATLFFLSTYIYV